MSEEPRRTDGARRTVLLLADDHPRHAATTREHREALQRLSRHRVHLLNPIALSPELRIDLRDFDAVIIHYTTVTTMDHYLPPPMREALARFRGLKIQMIQDDYRDVERFRSRMRELGIGVLFTLVPEHSVERVWPAAELPGVERITTLAGYVPIGAERTVSPPLGERPFDVVYRGRELPFWLGRLGQEKMQICQGVRARAAEHGLAVDIDWREDARIYGRRWTQLLESGRAALGTESGSSITDFDGSLQVRVDAYLADNPGADFEEVHAAILAPFEGNVMMNIVSPRVFEAAATRTAMVMFPGTYSGVVVPGRDYIVLEKDFSNFAEVAERVRDVGYLTELTNGAYERLIASGDYRIDRFVERVDRAIDEHAPLRGPAVQRAIRDNVRLRPTRPAPLAARLAIKGRVAAERRQAEARQTIRRLEPRYRHLRYRLGVRGAQALEYAGKSALALALVGREPAAREVARQWLSVTVRRRRPATGARALTEDLLKIGVAAGIAGGRPWPPVREQGLGIEVEEHPAGVVLRTVSQFGRPTVLERPLDIAFWDHSSAGERLHVSLPGSRVLELWIGDGGRAHDFCAIRALADATRR